MQEWLCPTLSLESLEAADGVDTPIIICKLRSTIGLIPESIELDALWNRLGYDPKPSIVALLCSWSPKAFGTW